VKPQNGWPLQDEREDSCVSHDAIEGAAREPGQPRVWHVRDEPLRRGCSGRIFDRRDCRRIAEEKFSDRVIVEAYERLYREVVKGRETA
jgi:hypothetical protein